MRRKSKPAGVQLVVPAQVSTRHAALAHLQASDHTHDDGRDEEQHYLVHLMQLLGLLPPGVTTVDQGTAG